MNGKSLSKLAVDITSAWEGRPWGWHADHKAYGILGFEGYMLKRLIHDYSKATGKKITEKDLDVLDKNHVMRQCQKQLAYRYFREIMAYSFYPRGLKSPWAACVIFDLAINNGKNNAILSNAQVRLGYGSGEKMDISKLSVFKEDTYVIQVCKERVKDYERVEKKWHGLARRYKWFLDVAIHREVYDGAHFPMSLKPNGVSVMIPQGRVIMSS